MNWDIRKGEKFPIVIRKMFEMEGEVFSTRELRDQVEEDFMAPGSFNTLLRSLEDAGYVMLVRQGSRGRGNSSTYRISEKAWKWWDLHGSEEDWGYGVEWQGCVEDVVPESKLWDALCQGKQVRLSMPCERKQWKNLLEVFRSGKVEIVVRLRK